MHRLYACVTNCDLSADIYCVFWAACTDTVPVLSPRFFTSERIRLRVTFAGFGN